MNKFTCYDINECSSDSHGCDHYCQNSDGSYSCHCSTGYKLASDGRACEDINECNQVPNVCSQQCTNTMGSYSCRCISGYRLDSDKKTCNDIDECSENTNLCPSPKKCVNQPGTYQCDCLNGYQKLQNPERCVDINECTSGTHLCEQTCTNNVGSYACSCDSDYYLASTYTCEIITFAVSIILYSYSSNYAQFRTRVQFNPTSYSVSVTNQVHAQDLSFGNGKYEVNTPTTSNYPVSSSLKPYRWYRFYVTTTGTLYSDDSNVYTYRTATSTPSAPPENVRATASTSNTLRIEWAAPPSTDRNGIITGYTLQYKINNAQSYTSLSSTTTTLATITSLNEFTEYQIRVAAATSSGLGPYSDAIVETTNEARPVSAPHIQVTDVGTDSIGITLTAPSVDERNGEITDYQVLYYGETIDQTVKTIDIPPNNNGGNSVTYVLAQLEENVVYHIKSRIWTQIGQGPYSVDTIRKTLPAVPSGAPIDLTFNSVLTTSLSLSWNPPPIREQNSDTIAYRVQYYGNSFDNSVRNVTTSNTNVLLTGLEEGEVYTVMVCSYNSLGDGPCEVIEQSTQEDLPIGYPQSVNAVALHDTGISVFWNPLVEDEANGAILRYEVSVNGTQHDSQMHFYSTVETILSVNNLEEYERYLVQVRAVNSIGAGPYSSVVEVRTHQDVPAGAPRDLQGTSKKASILLTWNAPVAAEINGELNTFEVHYAGTLEDKGNRTEKVGNITQYDLAQLVSDETYLIQVRAYTSVGAGPYTTWIVIRTREDAPTSPPTVVRTIAHSSTVIEVLWKAPVKQGQNGVITGYDVEITAVLSSLVTTQSVVASNDLYTFTNLKPHRQYSFRIAAKTQAGVGPFSTPITQLTLQDIPDSPPSSLHIVNTTARTVTLGWTPVSDDAINGVLRHYELVTSAFASILKIEPGLTSYTILGLMPNTQYTVMIAAETSPGTGPYTVPLNFTTREEAPSQGPDIDSVHSITPTTFVITWSATPETTQNGAITGYEIFVTEEETGEKVFYKLTEASETSIHVRKLNEYTRYRVSVDAINSAGSSPSTIISVETAQSIPSSPPQYIASIVNTTWIELNWFAPIEEDQNGIITGYIIHINDWTVTTELTMHTFTQLEEASEYTIQIAAMTLVGTGPLSPAINLTTLPVAPSAPPQDVNATAIASDKILVTWKPIPPFEQNGLILKYIVHYWIVNMNNTLEVVSNSTSTGVTLEPLDAHTIYQVLVFAVNVVGNSPNSKVFTVKTWEDIPTTPPGNFSARVLSPSSITLMWTHVPLNERNGIIIEQTLIYQGSKIDTERHYITMNSSRTNYTFTDFYPSVKYNFSLHQSTIVGNGPRSYATITMPETVPTAAPMYIWITNIETGFHVEWNELSLVSRNGEIVLYEVSLATVSNGSNDSAWSILYNSTNPEIGLTNLTVSTLYSIKVRAMTSVGYGPYSEPLQALTAPEELQCFGYFSLYEKDPCQNGAVCQPENANDYTCDCVPGYDGVICQNEINECLSHECKYGTCIDQINNFTCNCFAGYTGRFCEIELNECASEPCQNGGTCVDKVNDYECYCTDDYLGSDCEFLNKCLQRPCQHGSCHPVDDKYVCSCDHGYQGENCDVNINDCANVVCENGGECLDGVTKFDCTCYYGYKGRYCQYPSNMLTCESETNSRIKWPATEYSTISVIPCQYIDPSFVSGNVTRKCSQFGAWEPVQMSACIRQPFALLSTHLHEYDDIFGESTQIDINNITEVLQNTAYIVCERSLLSPEEIMLSLNLTEYALRSINKLNPEEKSSLITSLNEQFLCIFSAIVSTNNVAFFTSRDQNMSASLFHTLELFSIIRAQTFIKMPNNSCNSISADFIQMTVTEIDMKLNSTYLNVLSDCSHTNASHEGNSVLFPPSLTEALSDSNAQLGVSVLYSKTLGQILTRSSSGLYAEYEPATAMAMVELATDLPNQLRSPIRLNFSVLNSDYGDYIAHCVHWDVATQGWSEHGLSVYDASYGSITCSSSHLSTFMVLFESIVVSTPVEIILTYILYGICGVSLLCLIASVILIISLGKKFVESDIYIAHLSLAFAIILSVASHLIGLLYYTPIQDFCHVLAIIVYFFSLASVTCLLAEGSAICFRFVLIKVKRRIHILLIALGWIVPIPLVVFRGVLDINDLGVQAKYCWLSSQSSVIWSMTEPILVIFFITLLGMLVSLIRWCSLPRIEQVRIAGFALSGHMILAPFILAPWILTIINVYVTVPYYRWAYCSLVALQGILFFILYAIRNKEIRAQLRVCKTRTQKDGENDQESMGDFPLPLSEKPTTANNLFSNPIFDDEMMKDEGATAYPCDKLPEIPEKEPGMGYNNTVTENDYSELFFKESKVDIPFGSAKDESFYTIYKGHSGDRTSLFSDNIFSEIEDRYGVSPTRTFQKSIADVVIANEEICGDGSDQLSIEIPGDDVSANEVVCGNGSEKLSIEIPGAVVIANEKICVEGDDKLSLDSVKAESIVEPDSSNV